MSPGNSADSTIYPPGWHQDRQHRRKKAEVRNSGGSMLGTEAANLKATSGPVYEKWGRDRARRFPGGARMLLKKMHLLDINPTELTVLLNVLMHWWRTKRCDLREPGSTGEKGGGVHKRRPEYLMRTRGPVT
jgi:hypothetical protein